MRQYNNGGQVRRGDICCQRTIQDILGITDEIEDTEENILQDKNAAEYLGDVRLFHTFVRDTKTSPYRYAGLCAAGEGGNMHPKGSRLTFIISQYHADTDEGTALNERFAAALARAVVSRGDIPIAPHLYFTRFMVDFGIERDFGIEAGHLLMEKCDSVLIATIDGTISPGMRSDIEYATVKLGLDPKTIDFTRDGAVEFITETENDKYEERNRAEH
jgi:hypothetical protein